MSKNNYTRLCTFYGCFKKYHARGFCMMHYSATDFKKYSTKQYRKRNPEKLTIWKTQQQRRWQAKYPEKVKAYSQKYRAQKIEGLKRFGWIDERLVTNYPSRICGICGLKIKSKFELDHIIPLSRNGTHTLDNLQLVHPICNRTKSGRLQKEIVMDTMILRELIINDD
jgi:5-methylcytosine-specific restriction endonuclease McrA